MSYFTNFSNLKVTNRTTSNTTTVFNSANIGSDNTLVIYGGVNGSVLQTDGTGNLVWVNPRGSVDPADVPATSVFFNDEGSFGGTVNLTYNSVTQSLDSTNYVRTGNVNITGVFQMPGLPSISGGFANQLAVSTGAGGLTWGYTGDSVYFTSFRPNVSTVGATNTGASQFDVAGDQTATFVANTVVAFSNAATNLFRVANSVYNSGANTTTVNTARPIIVNTDTTSYINAVPAPAGTNTLYIAGQYLNAFSPGTQLFLANQPTGQPLIVANSYIDYQDTGFVTATQNPLNYLVLQGDARNSLFTNNQVFIGQPSGTIYTIASPGIYSVGANSTYFQTTPPLTITPAGQTVYYARQQTNVTLTTNLTVDVGSGVNIYTSQPIPSGTTVYLATQTPFTDIVFNNIQSYNFSPKLGISYPNPTTNPGGVVLNAGNLQFGGNTSFTFSNAQVLSVPTLNLNSGANVSMSSNTISIGAGGRLNFTNEQSSQHFMNFTQTPSSRGNITGNLNLTTPSYNSIRSKNTDNKYSLVEGGTGGSSTFSYGSQYCISAVPSEVEVRYTRDTKIPTSAVKYNSITGLYYDTVNNGWVNGSGENMVVYVNYNVFWKFELSIQNNDDGARSVWLSINGDITKRRYGSDNQHVNYWEYGFPPFGDIYGAPLAQTGGAVLYLEPGDRIELWAWQNGFAATQPDIAYLGGGNTRFVSSDRKYYTNYIYSSAQQKLIGQYDNFVDTGYSSWLQISRLDR